MQGADQEWQAKPMLSTRWHVRSSLVGSRHSRSQAEGLPAKTTMSPMPSAESCFALVTIGGVQRGCYTRKKSRIRPSSPTSTSENTEQAMVDPSHTACAD